MSGDYWWKAVGRNCYVLLKDTGIGDGIAQGYAQQVNWPCGAWHWRTDHGEGTAATCDDAMDAAEDSLEER